MIFLNSKCSWAFTNDIRLNTYFVVKPWCEEGRSADRQEEGENVSWERFIKMYDMLQKSKIPNKYSTGRLGFILPHSNCYTWDPW